MIKRRTRPQVRVRETSEEVNDSQDNQQGSADEEEDKSLPLSELLELRKLRRSRQGIDVQKLSRGDAKRKKRRDIDEDEHHDIGGLKPGAKLDDEDGGIDAKARRAVRTNNFTQQTNTVDVDKHMMAYIEENLMIRSRPPDPSESKSKDASAQDEFTLSERWKIEKKIANEGSVTASMSMLTAIPEVDLGMDTRLKNIEETEKAKRQVAEERKEHKKVDNDEEHLVATRFYRPHIKQKSDAEIMRNAKLQAMGLPVPEERRPRNDRPQMATDDIVMERFKKRMRR
ncbi:hepatocellular carcinoma-associated antigen 59-domain-containing protein [Pisolithus orientalis]|uniref:hepatocellular carcinoma-associated antigen 59-domain-containing protein n=1 Tax=Pisolithus orientalis TaxID=936130 RepID=UPI002223FECC|nr:hepatocellular carcinoma-associated antigen 59-domain-containing protein [Pisolithus orientalis]KAI6034903.1 hepatocellular carcinoma-associated antigen 59-domain-containing protein [Pisolithus orientalis]